MNEALIGLADAPVPFGLIPMGTANVLAHEVALPRTPEALAHLLVYGPVRPMAT